MHVLITFIIIFLFHFSSSTLTTQQGKLTPLFDGKTLNGWHTIPVCQCQVKDGAIVITTPKSAPRHVLLITNKIYRNFVSRVKIKVLKDDRGFYFRFDEVALKLGVNVF